MDNITDEMKIANCKACLPAQAMKDCKNCAFSIGLEYKEPVKVKPVESSLP